MSGYISYPIESDRDALLDDMYSYIKDRVAGWVENDGSLDTWLLQISATQAADLLSVATDIPDTIFRYMGRYLIGYPDVVATQAIVSTTWTMVDTAGYTIPAGTQVGVYNALNELVPFAVVATVVVPPGSTATAAGGVSLVAIEPGAAASGLGGVGAAMELIDPLAFVASVVMTGATLGGQDAETDDEYRNRLVRYLRRLSTRPIIPVDFSDMAREVNGVARAVAIDGYNPFHNLLTLNQASLETDTTGWVAVTNTTITRDNTRASSGAASLRLRSVAAGNMSAGTTPANQIAVGPGEQLVASAEFRRATTARNVYVAIQWYTAASAFISESAGSQVTEDAGGLWSQASVVAVAPTTAAFAVVVVYVVGTGAALEDHNVDKILLRRGTDPLWSAGGTVAPNNERMIAVAGLDANGNNLASPVKAAVDTLLQSNREINFIVNVIDPVRNTINVTFSIAVIPGYLAADVVASAVAAVTDYLSPVNWGQDPRYSGTSDDTWIDTTILYYNDLIQVISNVQGVDRVVTLTYALDPVTLASPASITLPGPAAVTVPGAIIGSAV